MTENFTISSLQEYPTEVLIHIFLYLSPKHLYSCRQVCLRWKEIIDDICEDESFWERHCKADFFEISYIAYHKSKWSVQWSNIYRSLTLWPQLRHSKQTIDELDLTSDTEETVYDFQILREGLIVVHLESCIVYYDIETLKPAKLPKLIGDCLKYLENDYAFVVHDISFGLLIMKKYLKRNEKESSISVYNVETCTLAGRRVYYVTRKAELCVCDLSDDDLTTKVLSDIPNGVVSINYHDNIVYILTRTYYIYMFRKEKICLVDNIKNKDDRLDTLRNYGFLQRLDQLFFYQWWKKTIYDEIKSVKYVSVIKTYGDIVFVGTVSGVLQIYHIKSNEKLTFNKEPLKEIDFREKNKPFVCIRQIDVLEGDDAHKVIVAMTSRIAVINFVHNSVKT